MPSGCDIHRELLPIEIEALTADVAEVSLSKRKFAREQALLTSLNFDSRPLRYEEIPEAYRKTFGWIFEASNENIEVQQSATYRNFVPWLQRGNGAFWISGKPGSGKSTLMKFLAGASETQRPLSRWAYPKRIVTVSHYVWSAGSPMQRSRAGLFRSLLYELLKQVPGLIGALCKDAMDDLEMNQLQSRRWQLGELESALRRLPCLDILPVKIYFIIDGLDELEGDLFPICDTLIDLCSSPDVKLCVASRPWNVFENHFGAESKNKFYIHELTTNDIKHYTESRLYRHSNRVQIRAGEKSIAAFVDEVAERANGVFLWVTLVTNMLCEGLTNDDSFSDLWKRLQSVPDDLELFFKQILSSVEPFYHQKMSGVLQITLAAKSPLPLQIYTFHELQYEDESYALKQPLLAMSSDDYEDFHRPTRRRLNAWCKGLLEPHQNGVQFIHRTVQDFLNTDTMIEFLRHKTSRKFHPELSTARAYVAWIKRSSFVDVDIDTSLECMRDNEFNERVGRVLMLARSLQYASIEVQNLCNDLLDDFEVSLKTMTASEQIQSDMVLDEDITRTSAMESRFRGLIVTHDIHRYVGRKYLGDPNYLDGLYEAPPSLAITQWYNDIDSDPLIDIGESLDDAASSRMIEVLLKHQNDINEEICEGGLDDSTTPWVNFMSSVASLDPRQPKDRCFFDIILQSGIIDLLLSHRADPNAGIPFLRLSACSCWIAWLLLPFIFPNFLSQPYLDTLKLMLVSGANTGTMTTRSDECLKWIVQCTGPENSFYLENWEASSFSSFWDVFSNAIRKLTHPRYTGEGKELLTKTIVIFAMFSKDVLRGWNELLTDLERVFSQDQYRRILEALGLVPTNPTSIEASFSKKRRIAVSTRQRTTSAVKKRKTAS